MCGDVCLVAVREEINMSARDPLFDVVKCVAMYFVVRGHLVAQGIIHASPAGGG